MSTYSAPSPPLPPPGSPGRTRPSEEGAALAALAGLPYMTWERLDKLLEGVSAARAWEAVRRGRHGAALAKAAARVCLDAVAAAHEEAGVAVRVRGTDDYPSVLADDHQAPAVLFSVGSLHGLARPRAAIVGTRRCTNYGRDVARELGRQLAEAGVCVVSGLAMGIDGAAHEGALAGGGAPPIAVVGSGLDVVYPRRNARLWQRVGQAGALLSEAPLGARPEPWRFPARNRVIAALADVLVVVESHVTGGSMHTVRAAEERGVSVLAVPGPIKSGASAGANQLLSQGCHPVCDAQDVLVALSISGSNALRDPMWPWPSDQPDPPFGEHGGAPDAPPAPALRLVGRPPETRSPPPPPYVPVLEALEYQLRSMERVVDACGLPPAEVAVALAWLEREGWASCESGWWERRG